MKKQVIWLTGLSGSGKSTIANYLVKYLKEHGVKHTINLDGDLLRTGINSNLGFSKEDRDENIRRTAEIAKLFLNEDYMVICSLISPLESQRQMAKDIIGGENFYEVYVYCPLDTCMQRDPKGLYKKAILNKIPNFTGLTAPYEEPKNPKLVLTTESESVNSCCQHILKQIFN